VKLHEIREKVANSHPDEWERLASGPDYLDRFTQISGGERTWLELNWHNGVAVYQDDVDIRLAFGMEVDRDLDLGWTFPDPQTTRDLVDLFWRGSLVYRWSVYSVDGGRAYLPQVRPATVETGPGAVDMELVAWYASAEDVKIARLAHVFNGGREDEFADYLSRTNIIERPA
jgi:hypothetical protein